MKMRNVDKTEYVNSSGLAPALLCCIAAGCSPANRQTSMFNEFFQLVLIPLHQPRTGDSVTVSVDIATFQTQNSMNMLQGLPFLVKVGFHRKKVDIQCRESSFKL